MIDPRILISIGVGIVGIAITVYIYYMWNRLKQWAKNWIASHESIRQIICDVELLAIERAAAIKRGVNKFKLVVFGIEDTGAKVRIVTEEDIDIDQYEEVAKKIKEAPILA